jgi:hypothetical protein
LIVLSALAPACLRPRVWPARASVRVGSVLQIEERIAPDRDPALALAISLSYIPMPPSRASARGDARRAQARLVHLGTGRFHPVVQNGERARIGVDRHTATFATRSAVMSPWVGPIPPVVKTYV